ncbi:hypothetical protein RRG08_040951 [Elysia crispata]|uniref:Uncharacterized protein n=1 Tax=Elysia crispata TaxID=231223 RepID=A0AAE1AMS0_9GAST|nr:hypothetical protein RRG08_040951 [Elysia crispata]
MSTPVRGRDEFGFHCIIMRQGNPEMLGVLAATKDLFGASRVLPRTLRVRDTEQAIRTVGTFQIGRH